MANRETGRIAILPRATLALDRDVAKDALDRAQTFKLTDEQLFSRNAIIESALDQELFTKKADVAGRKLSSSGKLSEADRALGQIEAGKAQTKVDNAEKSLRALRNGIEGTPMAPWTGKLSEAELSAVAYYVRGFYQPDGPENGLEKR